MIDNKTNERHFQRIHFDCLVKFETEDLRLDCELMDISLRGALIHNCTGATPKVGTSCKLILCLDEACDTKILMEGHIAHKKENSIGISCQYIDLDSITHLRKLVELNLTDPSLLQREIKFFIQVK